MQRDGVVEVWEKRSFFFMNFQFTPSLPYLRKNLALKCSTSFDSVYPISNIAGTSIAGMMSLSLSGSAAKGCDESISVLRSGQTVWNSVEGVLNLRRHIQPY